MDLKYVKCPVILLMACGPLASSVAIASPQDAATMVGDRFVKADANGDRAIDRVEAEAWLPRLSVHFDQFDANRDGRLTMAEIEQSLQSRWVAIDANHDGYIDKAEAERAAMPRLGLAVDWLDSNRDGRLSQQELEHVAGRFGVRGSDRARR